LSNENGVVEVEVVKTLDGMVSFMCLMTQPNFPEGLIRLHMKYPEVNLCLRDVEYIDCDYELSYEIPTDVSSRIERSANDLAMLNRELAPSSCSVIKGMCFGPRFEFRFEQGIRSGIWVPDKVLWILSRWRGFVPVDYHHPLLEKAMVFQHQSTKLSLPFETLEPSQEAYSGLKIIVRKSNLRQQHV